MQIDGVAMSSLLAPAITNMFVEYHEEDSFAVSSVVFDATLTDFC